MDLLDRMNATRFLGSEFLTNLWYRSDTQGGLVEVNDGLPAAEVWFINRILLTGAGQGADSVAVKTEEPSTSEEARQALREGKKVDRATLRIVRGQREWTVTLGADLQFRSVKVPGLLTREEDDRVRERFALVDEVGALVRGLFAQFMAIRTDPKAWAAELREMRAWVRGEESPDAVVDKVAEMVERHGPEAAADRLDVAGRLIEELGEEGAAQFARDREAGMPLKEAFARAVQKRLDDALSGRDKPGAALREAAAALRKVGQKPTPDPVDPAAKDAAAREARADALDRIAGVMGIQHLDRVGRGGLAYANMGGLGPELRERVIQRVQAGEDARKVLTEALAECDRQRAAKAADGDVEAGIRFAGAPGQREFSVVIPASAGPILKQAAEALRKGEVQP